MIDTATNHIPTKRGILLGEVRRLEALAQSLANALTESRAKVAALTARVAELEAALGAILPVVEDWCHAVSEDPSWDSWDHHYKTLQWSDILPKARAALTEGDTNG